MRFCMGDRCINKNTGILCEKNAGIFIHPQNKNLINRTMKCPRNIVSKLQGRIVFTFSRWLIVSRRTLTCFAKSSCVMFNLVRYSFIFVTNAMVHLPVHQLVCRKRT